MSSGIQDIVQEFRSRPQQVLDRLVDGELGVEDRRALLAALDEVPGAWRQCALAFIEAQAFGWQLSRVANEPLVAQETSPRRPSSAKRPGWFTWPLALAASVLVAFLLGQQLAEQRNGSPESRSGAIAVDAAPANVHSKPTATAQLEAVDPPDTEGKLTSVTLRPFGDEDAIELPVMESDDAATIDAAGRSLAVSGALAQQFQRDGFEVDRQQQFWPVELPDGRSVLVPVEEIHIQSPAVERL